MNPSAYYQTAKVIYDFWCANGLTSDQACGMVAQADAEASLNPKAVGDHGQAFGLDQWHRDRAVAILKGCGVDLTKSPPLEDQLKAALWELQHTEHKAFAAIKAQTSAYDAGFIACRLWERPGAIAQWAKRGGIAVKWSQYFNRLTLTNTA